MGVSGPSPAQRAQRPGGLPHGTGTMCRPSSAGQLDGRRLVLWLVLTYSDRLGEDRPARGLQVLQRLTDDDQDRLEIELVVVLSDLVGHPLQLGPRNGRVV